MIKIIFDGMIRAAGAYWRANRSAEDLWRIQAVIEAK